MASSDTMELMGESFVSLAEKLPIERISVSDIVAASGKNRKTFYYHFEDKAHLIRWVFRNDLAETLLERFDSDHLVYEREGDGAIADKPYYAFKKVGVRSLDGSEFFQALADTLEKRRAYYAKALHSTEKDGLRSYLYKLYVPALERDIRFILSNRSLSDSARALPCRVLYGGRNQLSRASNFRPRALERRHFERRRTVPKHHSLLPRERNQGTTATPRALNRLPMVRKQKAV